MSIDDAMTESIANTKNAVSCEILSAVSRSTEFLELLFHDYARGCDELAKISGRESLEFSREVSGDLFAMLLALSRLATYCERLRSLTPAEEARRLECINRINNAHADERRRVLKSSLVPDVDVVSGLKRYGFNPSKSAPLPAKAMSAADVLQGYGYDHNNEEGGPLAPFLWFGNHCRSPEHDYVRNLVTRWMQNTGRTASLRVLDIGTGTCTSLLSLARILPSDTCLYGCDISGTMLSRAILRLMDRKDNLNLIVCDAVDLPYENNAFDIVINFGSIDQTTDVGRAMTEMHRVVSQGGLVICRDEAFDPASLSPAKRAWFSHFGPSFGRSPPPIRWVPKESREMACFMLNELNFVLSFVK